MFSKSKSRKEKGKTNVAEGDDKKLSSKRAAVVDRVKGEALQECSDVEWDQSESAYSADLLNVKKKPDRVTVFAAPERSTDSARSRRQTPTPTSAQLEKRGMDSRDALTGLARLVTGIARQLHEDRASTQGVEVTVTMKIRNRNVEGNAVRSK